MDSEDFQADMKRNLTRRQFLKTAIIATAGVGPALSAADRPASQRIRLGVIGCGGRGQQLIQIFQQCPNMDIAAISDVIEPRLDQAMALFKDSVVKPERSVEYERLLERRDVDAVVIATTQHWHGLPHIHAAQAGKSIYIEKPLAHTVVEGRAMAFHDQTLRGVVGLRFPMGRINTSSQPHTINSLVGSGRWILFVEHAVAVRPVASAASMSRRVIALVGVSIRVFHGIPAKRTNFGRVIMI